jgi:hypothetical protein
MWIQPLRVAACRNVPGSCVAMTAVAGIVLVRSWGETAHMVSGASLTAHAAAQIAPVETVVTIIVVAAAGNVVRIKFATLTWFAWYHLHNIRNGYTGKSPDCGKYVAIYASLENGHTASDCIDNMNVAIRVTTKHAPQHVLEGRRVIL